MCSQAARRILRGGANQTDVRWRDAPVRDSAAAGLYALDQNRARLAEDHANARLSPNDWLDCGVVLDLSTVQTNIVIFKLEPDAPDAATVVARARERGALISAFATRTVRLVTHLNVDRGQPHTRQTSLPPLLRSFR